MSFEYTTWIPLVLILFTIFTLIIVNYRKKYYESLNNFWFFKSSKLSKVRLIVFISSFFLLFIASMDLRGPEERIKATIPDQKTIIIIDSSASMLAEDVRPNRFQRSLFLARHFIKRAAGHQIAVVLFSDTQKRLVPFTDDIDLLDARVAALENTDLKYGNSNINQAVKESLQYFKIDNDSEEIVGNILLFTDSEEHGGVFPLDEGSEVNLAVVGIGTAKGAPIPLRSKSGVFLNYKKHKGEKVISKLDENAIKSMGETFKNFRYWVATSYIIPTDQILDFFKGIYKKKLGETDIRIRPVYGHIIIIASIFLYLLASLFGLGKTIEKSALSLVLALSLLRVDSSYAQEEKLKLKEQERKLKAGKATSDERKFVAQELLKTGKAKEASILYEEINQSNSVDINALANMGTSYAGAGNLEKALESYEKALNLLPEGTNKDRFKKLVRNNTLLALKKKKQQQKSKKGKEKKKKDKKDKSKSDQSKEKKKGDQSEKSKQQKKDQGEQKKKKDEQKNEEKKKNEQKNKNEQESKKEKGEKKPSNLEEKEKQIKQKRKMVKIPAMLKQIMDQDRNLQKKYYKTNNKRKKRNSERRDW